MSMVLEKQDPRTYPFSIIYCFKIYSISSLDWIKKDTCLLNAVLHYIAAGHVVYLAVISDCNLVCFPQSKRSCRRGAFFRHFGEAVQDCSGIFSILLYVRT